MKLKKGDGAKPARRKVAPRATARNRTASFPIAGIGGSAGGLDAFTALLKHLPVDTGMAFIIVQHLDPEHESVLPQILARATTMPVREATQGMLVKANEVYVIPPNATLRLLRGRLELSPREASRQPHLSVDLFFKSLAHELKEGAIGIIFSGNASDGTLGLEAIKAAGGITFAQDKSARYDSMPRSAIASGCVDHVMAPSAVALELARIATHPYLRGKLPPLPVDLIAGDEAEVKRPATKKSPPAAAEAAKGRPALQGFAKILELAREQSGVDFSLYKTSTIHRRITRRMLLSKKNTLDDYARFVATDTKELKALYADLLIHVTSFFRDEPAFDVLKHIVFPRWLAEKRSGPLRMWSIGCSSGQEAYSLGMAFMEATNQIADGAPKLQIFGTDLNETLLNKARLGLYPKSLAQEITPERLRKFFVEEDGGYRVIKALREVCIFARQDLLGDPPFSRMDLVSCRNVLIYLDASAQKRVLPILHYALRSEGFLFLGLSESIGSATNLFEPLDKKQKLFLRRSTTTPAFSIPLRDRLRPAAPQLGGKRGPPTEALRTELPAQQEADRIMVSLFAPPGVLVDAGLNVLQFHGATEAFLSPPSGKASFQLLKMARNDLVLPLRAAIDQARKVSDVVRREKVRLEGPPAQTINLQVIPLRNLRERYFLVLFESPTGRPATASPMAAMLPAGRRGDPALRRRNVALERELRETRDYLQSLQQQHDTAHDELQASNEEVQSTNEELQSINEELETSKEELESGNEELITVNEEMAYRNGELTRLNSDLNNFHVSLSTPIVVLGRDLTIQRFTPLAEKVFNLMSTDIGRPIGGIKHNLAVDDLEGFLRKVIDLLAVRESEIQDKDGRWYLLRARPYLTVDNKVDGAVLVLLDIDALKRSEQAITQERNYAEATLRTARDPLVILRPDLTVNTANESFYRTFGLSPAQTENRPLFDLADGAWNIPALRALLADVLPRNHFFNDLEVTHRFGGVGERTMLLNGRRLESEAGEPLRILLSIEDVTERRRSRAALAASEIRYRRLFEAAKDGVIIVDPQTRRITDANPFMMHLLGYRRDEFIGKELFEIGLFRDEAVAQEAFRQLRDQREIRYDHLPLKGKDGTAHEVEVVANLYDEDGRPTIQCNVRDITERRRMEAELRASETRYRSLFESMDEGFCIIEVLFDEKGKAVDYRFETVNPSFAKQSGLDDARGKRMRELIPNHEEHWFKIYGRVASTGTPIRFTDEAKGLNRWFDVFCFPVADGNRRRVAVLFTDITERKRLERELQMSEAHFRELTQNLPIGVWTSQADGIVDFINRPWLEYSGVTLKHAMTHQDAWRKCIHPDDLAQAERIAAAGWDAGESYQLEARFREASTGNYRWFLKRSVPVCDAAGVVQKRIGICIDIDDLKRAQSILADHAGELEGQVHARTGELRETIGELEAFSYSVSHDMRAPLRAMQGFAQLLLRNHETTLDARSVDQLRRITAAAARLDALISDVLTYSRLLRSEIVLVPVDLDELVRRVIATYPQLQANDAEITIQGILPSVRANEASLTQVVSNLLTNAVKFVARGTAPRVKVRAEEQGDMVQVWFEDNGIGIDPNDQERIWTIFTRIERAKDYDGTGIGLAIVRKSIERMQGKIGLESAVGRGSKFWFRLPKS